MFPSVEGVGARVTGKKAGCDGGFTGGLDRRIPFDRAFSLKKGLLNPAPKR